MKSASLPLISTETLTPLRKLFRRRLFYNQENVTIKGGHSLWIISPLLLSSSVNLGNNDSSLGVMLSIDDY